MANDKENKSENEQKNFYIYQKISEKEAPKDLQKRVVGGKNLDAEELYRIAVRYAHGYNTEKDTKRACEYFLMAAELEYTPAQFKLAHAYERGRGVKQDFFEAAYWFRKAAENGHIAAQCHLGLLFAKGRGVIRNNQEAVYWYRKAAERDNSSAQNNLALMYEYGFGVEQDFNEAIRWYKKSAKKGNSSALKALDRLNIKRQPFLKRLWNSIHPTPREDDEEMGSDLSSKDLMK